MCKDSINVCQPPHISDSIIPFDRFHGQTIASERNYICTIHTVRNYICTGRTIRLLTNLFRKNVILSLDGEKMV